MAKILKWAGIVIGGLVGLIGLAVIAVFVLSGSRLNKTYDVEAVAIPTDEEALARDEYLARAVAPCTACHTDNLGGEAMIEDAVFGTLYSSNLTSGAGGVGAEYSDEDWVRVVRHGVKPDGTSVVFMPSQQFYYMSYENIWFNFSVF